MADELSNREVGKRFRKAVAHDLCRNGGGGSSRGGDWLLYNGLHVALRYSKCHVEGSHSSWFYGVKPRDVEMLLDDAAMLLVIPDEEGHCWALFSEAETKELLSRCKGSDRGDRKIHLRYDVDAARHTLQEWPELNLELRLGSLTDEALAIAAVTRTMGVGGASSEIATPDALNRDANDDKKSERPVPQRVPRRFDPSRLPTLSLRSTSDHDPAAILARREQATQAHQRLVTCLQAHLLSRGWSQVEEIPGAIDLWARRPLGAGRVIFECKSMTENPADGELSRCREGLAQLLEYRFEYGEPNDALCVVTDARLSPRRVRILESLAIGCLSFVNGGVERLGTRAEVILGL